MDNLKTLAMVGVIISLLGWLGPAFLKAYAAQKEGQQTAPQIEEPVRNQCWMVQPRVKACCDPRAQVIVYTGHGGGAAVVVSPKKYVDACASEGDK